jgi:hypothetical protein
MFPVDPEFLHCALYLYPSAQDARAGRSAGGTGFLVSVPSERHAHIVHLFAVSNRHVVVGGRYAAPAPVIRMNTVAGRTDVIDLSEGHWIPHPNGDDVTVAYLRAVDLQDFKYQAVPVDRFVTYENAFPEDESQRTYGANVWIGAPCFMVGRFVNHEGQQQNTPAVRFGTVSMLPLEPVWNDAAQQPQDSFLVEVHSIGGFSGSPVFMGHSSMFKGGLSWLLGVDWGHLRVKEYLYERRGDGEYARADSYVLANSGQAAVLPAWKLRALLDSDAAKAIRVAAE